MYRKSPGTQHLKDKQEQLRNSLVIPRERNQFMKVNRLQMPSREEKKRGGLYAPPEKPGIIHDRLLDDLKLLANSTGGSQKLTVHPRVANPLEFQKGLIPNETRLPGRIYQMQTKDLLSASLNFDKLKRTNPQLLR